MKIFNPQNTLLCDIQVDDRSVRYRSIMSDDSLTLYFSAPESVTIPLGSYVDFEGQRYTLFYPENFKKHNTRNFEYTLTLHGNRELLKRFKFKDTAAIPYRLKFPLTAKPVDFVTRIVLNMNVHDSGWTVGECVDAPDKLISFNHESCFDVLSRLAHEFSTEWEIAGKTIHLRKVEKFKDEPLALSYGKGNGFKSGTGRINDGDKIPIGRLYVQGGERNIDFSSYGSLTLLLPKLGTLVYEGKTYRTDAEGMSITRDGNTNVGEGSYDGSDIYPKRVGTVSQVITVDASKNLYDIKDSSIPTSLNYRDCRIAGKKATIVFQSGILAGREFDIEQSEDDLTGYIHAERRFKIVPQEQDGMIMPGGAYVPGVGDKYAVFNIRMPQAYIQNDSDKSGASWDMFLEAVKFFAEEETNKFQFTGALDGIWSKSRWLDIGGKVVPGGHVLFSDPQFLPNGEVIRIVSVKDYVNSPHKPEITLSNASVSGSFASGLAKLEADEVIVEKNRKDVIRFAQRQWRDTKETQEMLENSLLNFAGSVNPLTVRTMQLIAGDESLQFRFVNSKTNPVRVDHNITFSTATKKLTAAAGIIQHMTLGVTEISTGDRPQTYKFWDISGYTSPALTDTQTAFYLYLRCSKTSTAGTYKLSETAIAMEGETGYYHFLIGILNSEHSGDRSFAPVYGYTEVLPGRITTDKIIAQDGNTYFDLLNGIIAGKIIFGAGSSGLENIAEWKELSIGGVNLIRNGNFSAELNEWNINYSPSQTPPELSIVYTNLPSGAFSALRLKANGQHQGVWQNFVDTNQLELNKPYVLSFWARIDDPAGGEISCGHEGTYYNQMLSNIWTRYIIPFTPTHHSNFVFYSSRVKAVYITNIQLEQGTKPTAYRNHPYLERAIAGSTEINGGLVLGNVMGVKNENGKVTAGMNGLNSNPIRFWAGSPVQDMDKAPFKVFDDGKIELSNILEGKEISILNEPIGNLPDYLGNFAAQAIVNSFYESYTKQIDQYSGATFPNLIGATQNNPLDTPNYTERSVLKEFTLNAAAHVWFNVYASVTAPSEHETRTITLRLKNKTSGAVVIDSWDIDTQAPNTTGKWLHVNEQLPAGTYQIEGITRLTYAPGRDTDDYYSYATHGNISIGMSIDMENAAMKKEALQRVYLRSDGLLCVGAADEYLYVRQNASDYFLQAKGNMKLTSKNGNYSIEINNNGVYINGIKQ
ncbi:MAG TPA: hypothetical protein GXZ87_07605 [Bacteroidales bacterium]|nr:hypothetical protein [Bacteroidales bacterium]